MKKLRFEKPMPRGPQILLLLLFWMLQLNAQQFQVRNYSVKEGVAQSQVFALCQDPRGYLWMGTRGGGLTRFDGIEFKNYATKNGLGNNFIYRIVCDPSGDIWIATGGGFSKFNGKEFTNYSIPGSNNPIEVLDILVAGKNTVYLASLKGLYLYNGKSISLLTEDKPALNSIAMDKRGAIWYGTANGIFRYDTKKKSSTKFLEKKYIQKVFCDAEGKIWAGTYGYGIYIGGVNGFKQFVPSRYKDFKEVLEIYQDNKGFVWIGTLSQGIYRYDTLGRSFINIREKDGLSNNHVRSIICDREGNYWFGTSGGGVCHYFGLPFTHYDRESGLQGNFIYSVYADSKKRLWVGTSNSGITLLDSGKFKVIGAEEGFINTKVKAIIEDDDGNIYLGTEGDGLHKLSYITPDSFVITPVRSLRNSFVRGLAKTRDGSIWAATAGFGLFKIQKGEKDRDNLVVQNFTTNQGLLNNRLSALWVDEKDRIWYATENQGVAQWREKNTENNSPENSLLQNIAVRSLTVDAFGFAWAGTAGSGIYRWNVEDANSKPDNKKWNKFLTSLNIYLIAFDRKGNLFVGSESGLDYIELNKNREPVSVKHFGKNEGFVGIETCQNAVTTDANGNVWFGTINGLTACNPLAFTKNPVPPITGVSAVRLFYKELVQTPFKNFEGSWGNVTQLVLPYNQNHLTFDLRAISFSNPEQVAFQWMLQGFDAQWSPESGQKSVTYSNIPPGEYVFLVKARNGDGVWNPSPVAVSIVVRAPLWQTWWFIVSVLAVFIALVWFVFRLRLNGLRKKAAQAEAQLRLDKKVSDLEHQALRLQMNPHFIFNALNSIQSQIGEQNDQQARYYLAKFGRLMRQILDNSRKPLITLKEETDTLENYLLVEKFSSGDTFDYEVKTDPELDTDFIKIPPMLLQPFVENSIKHGFKNLVGRRGKITIDFWEKDHLLWCRITDNGVGRELAQQRAESEGESYHESTALKVIRERMQLMEDQSREAVIEIHDLSDAEGKPAGTEIKVAIPIS